MVRCMFATSGLALLTVETFFLGATNGTVRIVSSKRRCCDVV